MDFMDLFLCPTEERTAVEQVICSTEPYPGFCTQLGQSGGESPRIGDDWLTLSSGDRWSFSLHDLEYDNIISASEKRILKMLRLRRCGPPNRGYVGFDLDGE